MPFTSPLSLCLSLLVYVERPHLGPLNAHSVQHDSPVQLLCVCVCRQGGWTSVQPEDRPIGGDHSHLIHPPLKIVPDKLVASSLEAAVWSFIQIKTLSTLS